MLKYSDQYKTSLLCEPQRLILILHAFWLYMHHWPYVCVLHVLQVLQGINSAREGLVNWAIDRPPFLHTPHVLFQVFIHPRHSIHQIFHFSTTFKYDKTWNANIKNLYWWIKIRNLLKFVGVFLKVWLYINLYNIQTIRKYHNARIPWSNPTFDILHFIPWYMPPAPP